LKLKDVMEGIAGAVLMAVAILTPFLRYWRQWGATDAEVNRALPGDELVRHPKGGYTQAITIQTPRHRVWPWLAQIGQERGGFYSYDFLENLVGLNIHSVDRIIPERQHDEKSDGLRLAPKAPPVPLVTYESGRMLLFGGLPVPNTPTSWLFLLDELDENTTRLITRWRFDFKPSLANRIACNIFLDPIARVMQRKMLLGIKQLAESAREV